MKAKLCSSIAVAALAGFVTCAAAQTTPSPPSHPPPSVPPIPCHGATCTITVTVNDCGTVGGIAVDPPNQSMPVRTGPANIVWKIVTPGHIFSPDGIRFDPASQNFRRVPGGPANQIRMINSKGTTGLFYYYVDVLNCIPVDPFIQNF